MHLLFQTTLKLTYIFPECPALEEKKCSAGLIGIWMIIICKGIHNMYIWGDHIFAQIWHDMRVPAKIYNNLNWCIDLWSKKSESIGMCQRDNMVSASGSLPILGFPQDFQYIYLKSEETQSLVITKIWKSTRKKDIWKQYYDLHDSDFENWKTLEAWLITWTADWQKPSKDKNSWW